MGYLDEKLMEGEQVVFRTKRHAVVLVFPIIALALAITLVGLGGFGLLVTLLAACWIGRRPPGAWGFRIRRHG